MVIGGFGTEPILRSRLRLDPSGRHVTVAPHRRPEQRARFRSRQEEVGCGSCNGRGATPPQDPSLVRRIRDLPRESGLSPGVARLVRGRPGRLGCRADLGHHRRDRLPRSDHLLRACRHVPRQVGRRIGLRQRGVAEVHDPDRARGDVRLLDRVVGRALVPRPLHRLPRANRVVPGTAGWHLRLRRDVRGSVHGITSRPARCTSGSTM